MSKEYLNVYKATIRLISIKIPYIPSNSAMYLLNPRQSQNKIYSNQRGRPKQHLGKNLSKSNILFCDSKGHSTLTMTFELKLCDIFINYQMKEKFMSYNIV